jgi:putative acetyltransferase
MQAQFIIRPFELRDLDSAAQAMNASAREAYAFFGWDHPVERTRARMLELQASWSAMSVAEAGGGVIGFMALKPNFIDQIFIAPRWQGLGAGRQLMIEAKLAYPDFLELDCAEENHPARRFYERHGFREIKRGIHEELGIGEVLYRWTADK